MNAKASWLDYRERGSRGATRFMQWLALRCGRRVARLFLVPICAYFLLFSPRVRNTSREYLALALGRRPSFTDLWRHYFTFATTVLDRVYFIAGQFERFDIEVRGIELLRRTLARGRGCLLLGAHLGSFELLRTLAPEYRLPVNVVMYEDNAANIAAVLNPLLDPALRGPHGSANGLSAMPSVWNISAARRPTTGSTSMISGAGLRGSLLRAASVLLLASLPAAAQEEPWDFARLMAQLAQVQASRARYSEVRRVAVLQKPLQLSGTLLYARPAPRDPGAERRRLGDDHPRRIPVRVLGRTALLAWLAIVAASAWWTARHTAFTSDLTAFLPAASGRLERLLVAQLSEGVASRTMLIAIEGGAPLELARLSRELARALAADRRFDYVINGSAEFTQAARELGLRYRYLLSPTSSAERFSEQSLLRALRENLERLATLEGAAFKGMLARDPTGELRSLVEAAGRGSPASRHGVWFSGDGRRALLLAQTAASGMDAVRQQEAADALAGAVRASGPGPEYRVLVSGPGVFAARTRAAIEHDIGRLTGLAGALVLLILVVVYRSPGPVALSALPVLTGLVVGVAAVGVLFGTVHGITLAFGATLIGEAVDYPSYVFTQRKAGESVLELLARVWPTLRLAVLTTVFGSLALLLSSLQGLSQLGVLSMVGVFAAVLVTRWVLPALAPGRGAPPPRVLPFSLVRAGLAMRRAAWIAWVLLAAALAFIVARP